MKNIDKYGISNIAITAIVVVILIVAGIGITMYINNDNSNSNGVTYQGNGGSNEGDTHFTITNTTVQQNLFYYNNHVFIEWNTKSDGSGISHVQGDVVSNGTTLYAQWSTDYFTGMTIIQSNIPSVISTSLYVYIGSTEKALVSMGVSSSDMTYNSSSDYFYFSIDGVSNWIAYDTYLTFEYNDKTYSISISFSDTTPTYIVSSSGYAGEQFITNGQQNVTLRLSLVY